MNRALENLDCTLSKTVGGFQKRATLMWNSNIFPTAKGPKVFIPTQLQNYFINDF